MTEAGVHTIPAEQYHADELRDVPTLSSSIAHILTSKTPLHAWTAHPILNPNYEPTHKDHFDLGTVAHKLVLEQRTVEEAVTIVQADSWRTNAAKDQRDEARAAGRVALLEKDVDRVRAMLSTLARELGRFELEPTPLRHGTPEQTLVWAEKILTSDGPADVWCRARVDYLHDDYSTIDDYKTTSSSAAPGSWSRRAFEIGADVQTAFYARGVAHLRPAPRPPAVRYIVQESNPPYAVSVCSIGAAGWSVGNQKVDLALRLWHTCLERDRWPGYLAELAYADLPPWEESKWLERAELEEVRP